MTLGLRLSMEGVVCTLQEGDDFGKLALVNDSRRAATIALREDNSQFLVVDKHDFNRILRDVEANTVRLKEHGQDVLVLEKINLPRGVAIDHGMPSTSSKGQCCYSVMAGLPEKMIEYALETRVDAQADDGSEMDIFLEDFILTHIIYMPTNILCNYLKTYYTRKAQPDTRFGLSTTAAIDFEMDLEQRVAARRRVVAFLGFWVQTLGIHYFLDPAANAFVEELFCHVLEDHRSIPGMGPILQRMTSLRDLREDAMRTLARHPAVVLECGVLSTMAPAPNPVLPSDTCAVIIFRNQLTFLKCFDDGCDLRFNEVQYWATTEVLLASPPKRVNTLRKFIKIAMYRLPAKMRRHYAEFESLLDPSRNHRPYRALVAKMSPPLIPFVPLLLKDLTFVHEGNKTYFNGLVNFEKMVG
uniref:Cyclic nucleotide-binding domain-containing protein n=1 Tax=Heterorhabditis bacteriophora TaxID=37862 RepID=A0A1I7XQP8_HETBA